MSEPGEARYIVQTGVVLNQPVSARPVSSVGIIMIMYKAGTPSLFSRFRVLVGRFLIKSREPTLGCAIGLFARGIR